MEKAEHMTSLRRIDPDRNMARYYSVWLQQDLFGRICVFRSWGRFGTNGRTKVESFDSIEPAIALRERVERRKKRRGYSS